MSQKIGFDLTSTQIIIMVMMILCTLVIDIGIVKDLKKLESIKKRIMVIVLMILFTVTIVISILLKL